MAAKRVGRPSALLGISYLFQWLMYSRKNNANAVCRTSKAKTPSPKSWCDAFYLRMASAFGCTERICPVNLTLFFQNTRRLFSLTAVFGTGIRDVSMLLSQKPTESFGYLKSETTFNVTKRLMNGSMIWDGELLKYGNVS